jgi:hypothetical protein
MNAAQFSFMVVAAIAAGFMSWYIWQPSQSSGYRSRNFLKALRS